MKKSLLLIAAVILTAHLDAQNSLLDSLIIRASQTSSCPGSAVTLSANAYLNNKNLYYSKTYYISQSDLIGFDASCQSVRYGYNYNPMGFSWTDAGTGNVTDVKIEFAIGFEGCCGSSNHNTSLNNHAEPSFFPSFYWGSCDAPSFNPTITINANKADYNLGSTNTFLIQSFPQYPFGLRTWQTLNGYFARVTVTYKEDPNDDISYLWSPGGSTSTLLYVNPSVNTAYTLTAIYQGVATSTTYNVVVNPVPTITANGSTTICPGSSVTLTASNGGSYLWNTGATTQSISVSTPGNYSVTVENCSSSTPITVSYKPAPVITPSSYTTFCPGQSITLSATAGSSYLWSTGETTQSITVSSAGNYSVSVTDADRCTQMEQVNSREINKYMPLNGQEHL